MVNQQGSHPSSTHEYIKCVVVGDSGVGKTCLVCAWACNSRYILPQLVKTHTATVWAIDHYRTDVEIQKRSWVDVDGVNVSLRLWDTFGYHDKDRRFAYSSADVILCCFSTANARSLRNVKKIWYPEIRRFCPNVPVILVGTQADMRYMYTDERYVNIDKGLLHKAPVENDIVFPEKGREAAKDIGAPYYECSVLSQFGIVDVFCNTARACLIERRKVRFWIAQLRRVQYPVIQMPIEVPKPRLPTVKVLPSKFNKDFSYLQHMIYTADVVFSAQGSHFHAHKIGLASAAQAFSDLFVGDICCSTPTISPQGSIETESLRDCDAAFNGDEEQLIVTEPVIASPTENCLTNIIRTVVVPTHPAFVQVETMIGPTGSETLVTLNPDITPRAFQYVLEYLYKGHVTESCDYLEEIRTAASLLGLTSLSLVIMNVKTKDTFLNEEVHKAFLSERVARLKEIAFDKGLLSDVKFAVDDGIVHAHRSLLMVRCDVMTAMFSDNFRESSAHIIPLPGTNMSSFRALQEFLYTGQPPAAMASMDCLNVLEFANQLCLPRLVTLMEESIVTLLEAADAEGEEIVEDILVLVEQAQVHNADQLYQWCKQYLSLHYQDIFPRFTKLYKALQPYTQAFIEKNRWPPLWYVKEREYYDRRLRDNQERQQLELTRWQTCASSCLCFTRRRRACLYDGTEF